MKIVKKGAFAAVILLGLVVVLEILSRVGLGLLGGEQTSLSAVREHRASILASADANAGTGQNATAGEWNGVVLHPYLGYTLDPERRDVHGFGFSGPEGFFPDDPDAVVVAITGGSVSQGLWKKNRERLAARLAEVPEFAGRPIHILSLGVWGYKQPQQLMALTYFLALGGRLDILINVDGVNEIGNGYNLEAYREGQLHPAYPSPRTWRPLSGSLASPAVVAIAGEVKLLREAQGALARGAETLGWSATANLFWQLANRVLDNRILERQRNLDGENRHARRSLGDDDPGNGRVPPGRVSPTLADLWARTSLQMEYLARENHFSYYHFLQPNQYVPGSKPLTEHERKWAWDESSTGPFRRFVVAGYPLLRARGPQLRKSGVRFYDLTPLFENERVDVYRDNCCHLNPHGNAMLAEEIAKLIREDLETTPCFSESADHAGIAMTPARSSTRRCGQP